MPNINWFEAAKRITSDHAENLERDPLLARRLDKSPEAMVRYAETLVGVPVSHATPADAICPTCRVFEKTTGSELCPRCLRIQANRIVAYVRHRQHVEAVHREATERRLTEHDPHWRDRFTDYKVAERYYRVELQRAGRVVHSSPYEPPTIADDDVTFDDDLE
jgi:hypothetical protein